MKAENGAGTIERRAGNVAWVQVSLPRAFGEKLRRKRIPIEGSEKMTDAQARRAGAKLAADVRAGKIVFDEKPRKGSLQNKSKQKLVRELVIVFGGVESVLETIGEIYDLTSEDNS